MGAAAAVELPPAALVAPAAQGGARYRGEIGYSAVDVTRSKNKENIMALVGIAEGIKAYGLPNFQNAGTGYYRAHLYTNNHTPAAADTLASYTECADASYASVLLNSAWTYTTLAGPVTQAAYPQLTFNFAASANIYGYYVTDSGSDKVVWAELFAGAPVAFGPTAPLLLTLQITMQ
jgi:hypothetical protein